MDTNIDTYLQGVPEMGALGVSANCLLTRDSLRELGGEWAALFDRSGCEDVFLSHGWMSEWWDHWGGSNQLYVVTVRESGGRLLAVAPFYIEQPRVAWSARVLSFIGTKGVASDHLDVLVEPGFEQATIPAIVGAVLADRGRWDYIELADAEAGSSTFKLLCDQFTQAGLREHLTERPIRPYAELPANFDDYLMGLASAVRYNFRRRVRNLQRLGAVQFVCLRDYNEILARFPDLVRLHGLRFDHRKEYSAFLAPVAQTFHASLLGGRALRSWPRLFLLQVGVQTVAALYGFSIGKRFSFYQSGMDPAWAKSSVGLVLLGFCIQHMISSGHRQFDFLRGTPTYKLQWAKCGRPAVTARFFDHRLKGRLVLTRLQLRDWASRVKRGLRRALAGLYRGNSPAISTL